MSATIASRKPRSKPSRTARLERQGGNLSLVITQRWASGRVQQDRYWLAEIYAVPAGRGFTLRKQGGDYATYDTLVNSPEGPLCDCLGHEKHGHCKHAEALTALIQAGKL
jgi:hypothetical protein